MKEIILSVVCFHWLATLAAGAVAVAQAVQRSRTRIRGWAFPTQLVRGFPPVHERQDAQSEPTYSRAA